MIPSSAQMAENIRKHCEGMAREIARRVAEDPENSDATPYNVERHALLVLLDWYLGDFIPSEAVSGEIVDDIVPGQKQ
jgi:hypothetical protein